MLWRIYKLNGVYTDVRFHSKKKRKSARANGLTTHNEKRGVQKPAKNGAKLKSQMSKKKIINAMKQECILKKNSLFLCNFGLKILISFLILLYSSGSYSQSSMTAKEGFYFLLKVNQNSIIDDALKNRDNIALQVRWVDIYFHMFDKANYEYFRNDEFKWPEYSRKIAKEIYHGREIADFTRTYSYNCKASLGKYDAVDNSFPITLYYYTLSSDNRITFKITFGIIGLNFEDFDLKLKMNPLDAEKLINSRKDSYGKVNRNITAKVIYNVVNKDMEQFDKWDQKNIGVNIHKIILMNESLVIGEITAKTEQTQDLVNRPLKYTQLIGFQKSNSEKVSELFNASNWSKNTGKAYNFNTYGTNDNYHYMYNFNYVDGYDLCDIVYTMDRWTNEYGEQIELLQKSGHSNVIIYYTGESQFDKLENNVKNNFKLFVSRNEKDGTRKNYYRDGNTEIIFDKHYWLSSNGVNQTNQTSHVTYVISIVDISDIINIKAGQ